MGISRVVNTDFWNDGLVVDCFSPEDKYFMIYLLTNPHSRQAGIYKLNKKVAAFELGYSVEAVSVLIDRFSKKYKRIVYSNETQEVAILNYIKYSVLKGGKPVNDCIEKDLSCVSNKNLISIVYRHLESYFSSTDKESIVQIKDIFKKFSNGKEEDNDNDNDNDNEESYHESYHESPEKESKPRRVTKVYGEFRNVKLTDDELKKLQDKWIDWKEKLEIFSTDKELHGYKYTNDYLALLKWRFNDVIPKQAEQKRPTFNDSIPLI